MTDTSTDIIDNSSDNGQSDNATTGLDAEDNQQTSQQESTELATVFPITIEEDFLWDLCDNAGKPDTFSRTFHMMVQGIVGATTPVLFISQQLIHFHPPYGMVFHSHVYQLIERIALHIFNTFICGYQKP